MHIQKLFTMQILKTARINAHYLSYGYRVRRGALESVTNTCYQGQRRWFELPAAIRQLRKVTNGGVVECKEALTKCNWDLDAAIAYIRQKQQNSHYEIDVQKPIYGKVAVPSSLLNDSVVIELNCNCDFITSSKEFIDLSQNIRRALQRAVDLKQLANKDDVASSITSLDLDECNDAIFDGDEGTTVGHMLKRISGEYKRTIALSNVFVYRSRHPDLDYPGIYVHKKVGVAESIVGARVGLVNLRCGRSENVPKDAIDQHISCLAKTLAVQLVANPPKNSDSSTSAKENGVKSLMEQFHDQSWLQVDPVTSSVYAVCDALGKPRPHVGPQITVGQTLNIIGQILGTDSAYVEDAVYINSEEKTIKLGCS